MDYGFEIVFFFLFIEKIIYLMNYLMIHQFLIMKNMIYFMKKMILKTNYRKKYFPRIDFKEEKTMKKRKKLHIILKKLLILTSR